MSQARTVTSVNGSRYRLVKELGRGGQGAVYAVEGARLAVKLLNDRSSRAMERLRDQLAMVGRLPLEDLAVARPLELLRAPHVGYVMELFTGMVPLHHLVRPAKECKSPTQWYFDTGGLRRRLRLLAKASDVLAAIHGQGLAYVDPSPNNVFVSEDADFDVVRLIDTDNLRVSNSALAGVYTPGYGAPEVVRRGAVPNSLTDAHAFAVMAFETLALTHPLLGDGVRDGEPELEERALAGLLPWIDHPEDDANRSSDGIDREIVLSRALRREFERAFGPGLDDPTARPGMSRWSEHLHAAADRTIRCPSCGGTYFHNAVECPWCEEPRPAVLMVAAMLWEPERAKSRGGGETEVVPGILKDGDGKPRILDAVSLADGEDVEIPPRVTHPEQRAGGSLRVRFAGDRVELHPPAIHSWRLESAEGRKPPALGSGGVELAIRGHRVAWQLHTGPRELRHRVLRFDVHVGGGR